MNAHASAALFAVVLSAPAIANETAALSPCDQLVKLFIELAEKSGKTVSEAEARKEVLSENPTSAECSAMLILFEAQK